MKINPIGIQSYQELVRRDNPAAQPRADKPDTQPAPDKVSIDAGKAVERSKMAVRAQKGTFDEFLSVEERQALELLFSRFRGHERFVTEEADASGNSSNNNVGAWVDVKA